MSACSAASATTTSADAGGAVSGELGSNPDGGASSMTAPTWCDARAVLQAKCVRCHSAPPAHGAPFSLLSYADTQELDHSGKPRFEKMRAALDTELMPPTFLQLEPPVEQLTTDERATLLAWLAGDPPTDADGCQ